jgi:hypothetical protein
LFSPLSIDMLFLPLIVVSFPTRANRPFVRPFVASHADLVVFVSVFVIPSSPFMSRPLIPGFLFAVECPVWINATASSAPDLPAILWFTSNLPQFPGLPL